MSRAVVEYARVIAALGLLMFSVLGDPAHAQAPDSRPKASCGQLCGAWEQAGPDGAPAERLLEAALGKYHEPDALANSGAYARCEEEPCATPGPDPEDDFLDPKERRRNWRPTRAEMRDELLPKTKMASELELTWQDGRLEIRWDGDLRRYQPGESYVRVDAWGTAEVDCQWKNGRFIVREDYRRGRRNTDVYRYDAQSQMLFLERRLDRPGLSTVVLSRAYSKRR